MSKIELRRKMILKLAQEAAAPVDPIPTGTPKPISDPPSFNISLEYPGIYKVFKLNVIPYLVRFFQICNVAMQYSSLGKTNLKTLKAANFTYTPVIRDEKYVYNFVKMAINSCNSIENFLKLEQSAEFSNLSMLSSKELLTKIPSFKNELTVLFSTIKSLNA